MRLSANDWMKWMLKRYRSNPQVKPLIYRHMIAIEFAELHQNPNKNQRDFKRMESLCAQVLAGTSEGYGE